MLNRALVGHSELKIRENRQNEDMLCLSTCVRRLSIVIWSHECPWTYNIYVIHTYSVWLENFPLAFISFMHMKLGTGVKRREKIYLRDTDNMTIINVTENVILFGATKKKEKKK